MDRCEVCGNDYDKAFKILIGDTTRTFDCFECAIHALAPSCATCSVKILGHGMEKGEQAYCCAHCASAAGVTELRDRA